MKNLEIYETLYQLQIISQYPDQRTKKQLIEEYEISPSELNHWLQQYPYKELPEQLKSEQSKLQNVTLIKTNDITISTKIEKRKKRKENDDASQNNIITWHDYKNNPTEIVVQIKSATDLILKNTTPNDLQTIYNKLKKAQTKNQLIAAIRPILKQIENANPQRLKQYKEVSIAIIVKRIVYKYFRIKIQKIEKSPALNIQAQIINEADPIHILELLKEPYDPNTIKNGLIPLSIKAIKTAINRSCTHLCSSCTNADATHCSKIRHANKHCINKYPYITDGWQQFDKNGKIENFIIIGCQNYQKSPTTKSTKNKLELINSIISLYFDTETPDEALQLQQEQIQKKLLILPNHPINQEE